MLWQCVFLKNLLEESEGVTHLSSLRLLLHCLFCWLTVKVSQFGDGSQEWRICVSRKKSCYWRRCSETMITGLRITWASLEKPYNVASHTTSLLLILLDVVNNKQRGEGMLGQACREVCIISSSHSFKLLGYHIPSVLTIRFLPSANTATLIARSWHLSFIDASYMFRHA